ncbi:MAG: hypothetical protein OSJ83_02470 [Clostridia bacterium]|nr:hypothetical protein [Clostridia bacterium]
MQIAKKILKITGCVLGGIVALFLVVYALFAIIGCAMYGEYRDVREYACDIPALNSGFVPQGITYSEKYDKYIHTGYDGDNNTVTFIGNGDEFREVVLEDGDGSRLKGHAGGVTVAGEWVYVASNANLYMYSVKDMLSGEDSVPCAEVIPVDNNAAYCFSTDDELFVGEFYREQNYKTDEAHHYTTPNGDENKAIVSCYQLVGGRIAGATLQPYPKYRISITGLVQGIAVHDGVYMLSRSYGLVNSAIEYHSGLKPELPELPELSEVTFKNNADAPKIKVPLYYLDGTTLVKSLVAPSFTEDLAIAHDRLIVTNESACNKYIVGKLFGANKVYSLPVYKE